MNGLSIVAPWGYLGTLALGLFGVVQFGGNLVELDALSGLLIVLTSFVGYISLVVGVFSERGILNLYLASFLSLQGILVTVFLTRDLLVFYIAFEALLIPMVLVIGIWGGGANRIRASFLFFLYTLGGSLAMLIAILFLRLQFGTLSFQHLSNSALGLSPYTPWLWAGFVFAIAVKTPLYPFHLWLYRAHAEAPVAGSVLLAGVVLKMASYAFVRIPLGLYSETTYRFLPFLLTLALATLLLSSLSVLRQADFKAYIALSSVGHMAMVTLGLASCCYDGVQGGLLLSFAHGLVSPALFIVLGGTLYDRYHSRTILYYRGIVLLLPLTTTFFFVASCMNMAVPPSPNWLAELLILTGLISTSPLAAALASSGVVLSAAYTIWLFSRMSYGQWSPTLLPSKDASRQEVYLLVLLLSTALVLGLAPNNLLNLLWGFDTLT